MPFLLLIFAVQVKASIIYDNGPSIGDSTKCAGDSGKCNGEWSVFDDFILTGETKITAVQWDANLFVSDYTGATVGFYTADPVFEGGSLVQEFTGYGSVIGDDSDWTNVNITIQTEITLDAGVYWLGFQHHMLSNYASLDMSVDQTNGNATQWQNNGDGAKKYTYRELTFSIHGAASKSIPEPSILALFAVGLIGIGIARRRKQQA